MNDGSGKYAILGWGSLIWDLDILAPHVHGGWLIERGPRLRMEFTRISPKRKLALAVCLDNEHGVPCPTHVMVSARSDVLAARDDLAERERAPKAEIGAVCLETDLCAGRADFANQVRDWCIVEGWTGAVWTDLRSNYVALRKEYFSIARAVEYLKTLPDLSLDEAVTYIESAPLTTDTPLRRALAADPWWQDQVRRLKTVLEDRLPPEA
jgi:hypothetical protein